jgi:hypothetical protein
MCSLKAYTGITFLSCAKLHPIFTTDQIPLNGLEAAKGPQSWKLTENILKLQHHHTFLQGTVPDLLIISFQTSSLALG